MPQYRTPKGSARPFSRRTVFPAQVGHRGPPGHVAVLHPVGKLLHGAAAHIARNVGVAADLAAHFQELVGAEGVGLGHAAPVGVHNGLAGLFGADAVLPVVGVGKAAAGPAQHRHAQIPQGSHGVGAGAAVGVGQPAVDAAAQVFGKLPVDILVDGAGGPVAVDEDLCHKDLLAYRAANARFCSHYTGPPGAKTSGPVFFGTKVPGNNQYSSAGRWKCRGKSGTI